MLKTVQLIKSVVAGDFVKTVRDHVLDSIGSFKMPGFRPADAAAALGRNLTDAMLFTSEFWGAFVIQNSTRIDKILVYMPAPFFTPERLVPTKKNIGHPKLGLKLGLVFGTTGKKKSGRVVGFGVGDTSGKRYQMWRMDYLSQNSQFSRSWSRYRLER